MVNLGKNIFYPTINRYYPDENRIQHFLLAHLQTFLFAMVITVLMQFSNHLAIQLFQLFPVYFIIVMIECLIFWCQKYENLLYAYNCALLVVFTPLFFGIFFGLFHPTASLEFKQVQNCQMIGSLNKNIEGHEKYAILYVNFELDGEQYLGAACSSDQNQGSTTSTIYPYKFYYKYDSIQCGYGGDDVDDSNNHRRLTQTSSLNNTSQRFLQDSYGGYSYSTSQYDSYDSSDDSSGSCTRDYKWSKVKIASWICLKRGFDLEKFQEKQSCYVHFFSGSKAVENGLQRAAMKDEYNFPLISYYPTPFYPGDAFTCLIVFTYYFWLVSFSTIFYYTSFYILEKIKDIQCDMEGIVDKQQNKYEYD